MKQEREFRSLIQLAGAQRGVNPREQPFLSGAILQTPNDDSSWTHRGQITFTHGLASQHDSPWWDTNLATVSQKLWFCWQFLSRRCPLFKYIFHSVCCLTEYLCAAAPVQVHVHVRVHVQVMHVWVYSTYLPKSESVLLGVSLWSLRRFLSPYCQALLSCCLHGFLTVWGAMYPPVPPQHTNTPRWPQPERKVSTEPTASSGEVTLEKFLCLLYLTEKQLSPQSCEYIFAIFKPFSLVWIIVLLDEWVW